MLVRVTVRSRREHVLQHSQRLPERGRGQRADAPDQPPPIHTAMLLSVLRGFRAVHRWCIALGTGHSSERGIDCKQSLLMNVH